MKKLILTFSLLFLYTNCDSQTIDTSLVLKNIKLRLFSELDLYSLSNKVLDDYYNRPLKVEYLNSKGFNNFIFIKVIEQVLAIDSNYNDSSNLIAAYETPTCLNVNGECYFVFAYNKENNVIYKIGGTKTNEFISLYNTLSLHWYYWKPINKINNKLIKRFEKDFNVEGLDFSCLMKSLKHKKGKCLDYYSPDLIVY